MKQQPRPRTTEIFDAAPEVLIIDDDPDMAAALMDVVMSAGFSAVRAANGLRGVEHAQSWPPRLVLLDMRMPGLDGWGFLDRWRCHPLLSRIPVVVVSSEPVDSQLLPAVRSWLPKPVDAGELLRVVRALLCDGARDRATG